VKIFLQNFKVYWLKEKMIEKAQMKDLELEWKNVDKSIILQSKEVNKII
jgi:hypothetical protein